MASQTVTQRDVDRAIEHISNVQGILMCAVKMLDEEVAGSPMWEISEAIHASVALLSDSYCTLNDRSVALTIEGA